MVLFRPAASALVLLVAGVAQAATAWTFDDASVIVTAKKGGEPVKEKYGKFPGTRHLSEPLADLAFSALL